jgi:hypothetical protein
LDPTIHNSLAKEGVQEGDVIYIEAFSGSVKRVGRSDSFPTEFDLEAEEHVPLPFPRAMCIKRNKSFKMLRFMTWTWPMRIPIQWRQKECFEFGPSLGQAQEQ